MTDKGELYGSMQGGETSIITLEQLQSKADAIVETASGTLLNVKDSANAFFEELSVYGKSEQVQTTGKNLFNVDNIIQKTMPDGKTYWGYSYVLDAGDYTISCLNPNNYDGKTDYLYCRKLLNGEYSDNGIIYVVANGFPQTKKITIEQSEKLVFFNATPHNESESKEKFAKYLFQLEKGASATTYEPYTGGKPSPSVEYPQEIVNAGKLNEDTGKYSVDVKVNGANLLNEDHFFDMGNWKNGKYYMNLKPDTKYTFSRKDNSGVGSGLFLSVKNTVEGVLTQIVNSNSASSCKQRVTFTTNDSGEIYFDLQNNNKLNLKDFLGFGQLEVGIAATPYEPYKEQTLTLTSDRPLTKWDRLVEQDGQIGWLYATKYIENLAEIIRDNTPIYGTEQKYFNVLFENEKFNYSMEKVVSETGHYKANKELYTIDVKENTFLIKINADDTIQTAKEHLHYSVMYNTTQTEFVPLPQSEQDTIRALQTYYPTTVVSNSEDTEMQLTYVADTKNYTDRKIEEAVSAQTQSLANLLSLMPLSTQAAMIENDTNNILNMEVQK